MTHETTTNEDLTHEGLAHEASTHDKQAVHHRHSHTQSSVHAGGHHLLQVEDFSVSFAMYDSSARSFFGAKKLMRPIIANLSLSVHAGEVVAVVGASGAGKTLLADAILGLYEPNAEVKGRIWFDGDLQDSKSLAKLRGNGISLVPQSTANLDPLSTIGRQVRALSKTKNKTKQRELFLRYGLDEGTEKLYPHQLSGGMARRVLLCTALIDDPKVIIADEPTPGLDIDLAIKALSDFRSFANEGGGVLLITHDIELALKVADRVAVFKDGTIVEETAVENFASPHTLNHLFSKELWHALPEHGFKVVS